MYPKEPKYPEWLNVTFPQFTTTRSFRFFLTMHISSRVLVCRLTYFSLYLIHIAISKRSYTNEQREYMILGVVLPIGAIGSMEINDPI
jgi:hypothetical protein